MTVYIGDLLTASAASVTGKPTPSRTWQWLRNGTAISGATSSTYTVAEADLGANLSVKQIETNIAGSDDATSLTVGPVASFTPASLFASGEEGAWYEPSPTTAFTDTGGTVAATYGDPVAYLQDLSGNGNHATQTTLASRPILARVPETGRRNLLERTEEFDDTKWVKFNAASNNPIVSADQDGVADKITFGTINASNDVSLIYQEVSISTGIDYTFSVKLKAFDSGSVGKRVYIYLNDIGGAGTYAYTAHVLTSDYVQVSATGSGATLGSQVWITIATLGSDYFDNGGSPADSGAVVLAKEAQLELGSTATAYQKVVDEYDITEAGVTSLDYLSFDGTDDFMEVPVAATAGATELTTFAGVEFAADGYMIAARQDSNDWLYTTYLSSGDISTYYAAGATSSALTASSVLNTPYVHQTSFDQSVPEFSHRLNGVDSGNRVIGSATALQSTQGLYIGARNLAGTADLFTDGNLYSLIVRGASSTTDEIDNTEAYLAARSGVTIA